MAVMHNDTLVNLWWHPLLAKHLLHSLKCQSDSLKTLQCKNRCMNDLLMGCHPLKKSRKLALSGLQVCLYMLRVHL